MSSRDMSTTTNYVARYLRIGKANPFESNWRSVQPHIKEVVVALTSEEARMAEHLAREAVPHGYRYIGCVQAKT